MFYDSGESNGGNGVYSGIHGIDTSPELFGCDS